MARNMTAALAAALSATVVKPVFIAKFDFPSASVHLWSGNADLVWGGNTYTGLGDLSSINFPAETVSGSTAGASFALSGIPSSTTSLALDENYKNAPCRVWIGALNITTDALIADPYLKYRGIIDNMSMNDDGETAGITVNVEGFAYAVKPSGLRYTDEDQQRTYAGDNGLEFVAGLQGKEIVWGASGAQDMAGDQSNPVYGPYDYTDDGGAL